MKLKSYFLLYLIACAAICLSVVSCSLQGTHAPLPEALAALQSDSDVLFTQVAVPDWDNENYYVFQPKAAPASKALVFYGGATCDARDYAPMAREIARAGFMMVLVKMPGDISFSAPDRAATVIAAFPGIKTWAIGGHSMGGISACQFAREHLDTISAVVLWASWPSPQNKIDQTDLKALSISATNDGIYPPVKIKWSHAMLPADTVYVVIQGGNHGQFAWCTGDFKPVDHTATITLDEQSAQTVAATVSFLNSL